MLSWGKLIADRSFLFSDVRKQLDDFGESEVKQTDNNCENEDRYQNNAGRLHCILEGEPDDLLNFALIIAEEFCDLLPERATAYYAEKAAREARQGDDAQAELMRLLLGGAEGGSAE